MTAPGAVVDHLDGRRTESLAVHVTDATPDRSCPAFMRVPALRAEPWSVYTDRPR